jgi:hypothetical protein
MSIKQNIVYKSCGDYIVTLEKLDNTIDNEDHRLVNGDKINCLYRANQLKVLYIEHKFSKSSAIVTKLEYIIYDCCKNIHFMKYIPFDNCETQYGVYEIGKIIQVKHFCFNLQLDYTPGIQYYLDKQVAFDSEFSILLNGSRTLYSPCGLFCETTWYKDGKQHRDNDLPAVIKPEYLAWFRNGEYWRDDENLPCVILMTGEEHSSRKAMNEESKN